MKIIKSVALVIALPILCFGVFLAHSTLCDYQPQRTEILATNSLCDTLHASDSFSVLSWNIGYAGLDREMDFFYDGGKKVRPSKEQTVLNLDRITDFLAENDTLPFLLLQEVDRDAKRSYHIDQTAKFDEKLAHHASFFALNYSVGFVPIPISEPMGAVESGIQTLSKFRPLRSERNAFPFNFSWPLKVFMLDRCFLVNYYPMDNGKQLVLVNTHNSAFDDNGEIRKAELNLFRDFLVNEYEKGNYVITGGDFNQCPPKVKTAFEGEPFDFEDFVTIPDSLFPQDWNFAFDNKTPSNRRVIDAYKLGETKVTLIDFFITSPNVEVRNVRCVNLGFEHSDHNPVIASFKLK